MACGDAVDGGPVCVRCSRDPFAMEEARKRAALRGATEPLEDLYEPRYRYLKQGDVTRLVSDRFPPNKSPRARQRKGVP